MDASSFRIGLVRLVMGAAFMLLGFFLASTTSARADDLGLLGTGVVAAVVDEVSDTASDVVDGSSVPQAPLAPATEAVSDPVRAAEKVVAEPVEVLAEPVKMVEKPVRTVESAVAEPVETVNAVVAEPVAVVTKTATAAVTTTATVVKDTSVAVVRPLEPIVVPVVESVLTPVAPVIDQVVPVTDPGTSVIDPVDLGTPTVPTVGLAVPAAGGELVVDLGETSGRDTGEGRSAIVPDAAVLRGAVAATGAVDSSLAGSPMVAASLPGERAASVVRASGPDRPSDTPAPGPAQPAPSTVPGSGSTGSTGTNGLDAATAPSALTLPESSSAALTSVASPLCPGPALDPGSRPD